MTLEAINITDNGNVTYDEIARGEYEIWSVIMLGVFTFFGTVGNVGLLVVIVSTKHLRTVANIMVVNLTVGDLLYLLISVPFHIEHDISPSWDFGPIVCKLSQSGQVAAQGVCVFSLFAVSLERHQAITKPRVRSSEHNMMKTLAIVGVVWLVSITLSIPLMILAHTKVLYEADGPSCLFLPLFSKVAKGYIMSQFIVLYVLPLAAISCFYVNMARVLLQSENNFKHESQPGARQFLARRRLAIIVLVITVLFGVLWLPYYAYNIWFQFNEAALTDTDRIERIYIFLYVFQQLHFFMGVGNSCINPWVVFFMSSTHRQELINFMLCRKSTKTHDRRRYQAVRSSAPSCTNTNNHEHHELSQTLL